MPDETTLALRPDLFGQLAATDPFQCRARRLYERGQALAVNGNQADVRVGYDARNNPLDLREIPIVSGYIPRVGDWVAIQYEAGHSGAPWVAGPTMAADESEDTPGIGVFSVSAEEPADPQKSTVYFHEPASTWRGWNGAAWVDLGGGGGGSHNALPDLQGGAAGEYYHLTAAQWSALVASMPFGAGGVLYAGAAGALATDVANLSWAATYKRLRIGTAGGDIYSTYYGWYVGSDAHAMGVLSSAADAATPYLAFVRARGSMAAQTTVVQNDIIGNMVWDGHTGTAYRRGFEQRVYANTNWADGSDYGSRWELWGCVDGSAGRTKWLSMSNRQLQAVAGAESAPTYTYLDSPTTGQYLYAANVLGWATNGSTRMTLNSNGLALNVAGRSAFTAAYQLDLRGNYDGVISTYFANENAGSSTGMRGYWSSSGGGDTYHLMRVTDSGSKYWAYGIDRSEADRFAWGCDTSLGASDRMYLDRYGILWLFPYSTALTTEGELHQCSVQKTLRWFMGDTQQLGASLIDDARVTDATQSESGGAMSETTVSAHTFPTELSVSGNTAKIVAKGFGRVEAKVAGGGAHLYVRFKLEGTELIELDFSAPQGSGVNWCHFEFVLEATMRGSTAWEISNCRAAYYQTTGADPWPMQFSPAHLWWADDADFTVSGDVVTTVTAEVTNCNPGTAYCTVRKHQAGPEQV